MSVESRNNGLVPTGIEALDQVLDGGFLEGQVILLAGNPGAGKTTFGVHFLYSGLLKGEPAIFVGLVEPKSDFMEYMYNFGFDLKKYEEEEKFLFIEALSFNDPAGLEVLVRNILDAATKMGAKRLVIDSVSAFETIFKESKDARVFLHNTLLRALKSLKLTSIAIADMPFGTSVIGYGIEEFVFDGVIALRVEFETGLPRRRLVIKKLRARALPSSYFNMLIGKKGIRLIPPSFSSLAGNIGEGVASFGTKEVNLMLNGGPREGTVTILAGPSGSGKTMLALDFVLDGGRNGGRAGFISFEESEEQIRSHLLRMGASEQLISNILIVSQEVMLRTPYEIVEVLRESIAKVSPDRIVVDGLSALKRGYGEEDFYDSVRSMVNLCKEKKKTLLMTIIGNPLDEDIGLSTLADNVLALTFERVGDRILRRIGVVKARGMKTSEVMKTFSFGETGRIVVQV